ncbi:MAG TPA: methylated-DNA--[protein]-cysteine S-methyltransferase [Caldilineae bacterium]|nr:methylated-DNA--[protein]-cysteine S-methyltransferase [Caldilineae bacterium]
MHAHAYFHSPIGFLELTSDGETLLAVRFVDAPRAAHAPDAVLREAIRQLTGYFSGELIRFDLPIRLQGTPFQLSVWRQLLKIPFGQVRTYREIAQALGNRKAVRAVGGANARNPIAIIAPCHRVIASDGTLGGYAGGLWRKAWLLQHEGVLSMKPKYDKLF